MPICSSVFSGGSRDAWSLKCTGTVSVYVLSRFDSFPFGLCSTCPFESILHSLQKSAHVLPCGHVPLGGCACGGVSALHASMDELGSGALFPFRKCRLPIWKHLLHSVTNPGTRPGHHEHAGLRFHTHFPRTLVVVVLCPKKQQSSSGLVPAHPIASSGSSSDPAFLVAASWMFTDFL